MPRKKSKSERAHPYEDGYDDQPYQRRPGDTVTLLFDLLAGQFPSQSEVIDHLRNAEIEFLKALRSFLDKQIEHLETRCATATRPRVRKVDLSGS
ncbi:MAG: hypothetical protein HYR55_14450 [Acidobacteria bacterium]|nr:hypothetical protein [Acidobacteriota bacterium]MBI3657097.1 hypothetical protein [Acidobacteriota bacterium]